MIRTSRMVAKMAMMSIFSASLAAVSALADDSWTGAPDHNPMGQVTYLKIDNASSRTSALVRSGELRRTTMAHDTTNQTFKLKTYCKLDIRFMGVKEGTEMSNSPELFFTGAFIDSLRAGTIYDSPSLKIKHMGMKDVVNMDGRRYAGADDLYIYDIDPNGDGGGFGLNCLAAAMLKAAQQQAIAEGREIDAKAGIEDLKVRVVLHPDAPVLGEVKLDATGKYNGTNVKVGGDYLVQP